MVVFFIMLSFAVRGLAKAAFLPSEIFSIFSLFNLLIQILGKDSLVDFFVNKAGNGLCLYSELLPLGFASSAVCGSRPFKQDNEIADEV